MGWSQGPLGSVREAFGDVRGTWRRATLSKSEHFPRFCSDPARTHLRPAEAPSAQIGRRRDLEMVTPEVSTKIASPNVVGLKNKMGHQVDAGGERQRSRQQH